MMAKPEKEASDPVGVFSRSGAMSIGLSLLAGQFDAPTAACYYMMIFAQSTGVMTKMKAMYIIPTDNGPFCRHMWPRQF